MHLDPSSLLQKKKCLLVQDRCGAADNGFCDGAGCGGGASAGGLLCWWWWKRSWLWFVVLVLLLEVLLLVLVD